VVLNVVQGACGKMIESQRNCDSKFNMGHVCGHMTGSSDVKFPLSPKSIDEHR
jgi:hypothetical protein